MDNSIDARSTWIGESYIVKSIKDELNFRSEVKGEFTISVGTVGTENCCKEKGGNGVSSVKEEPLCWDDTEEEDSFSVDRNDTPLHFNHESNDNISIEKHEPCWNEEEAGIDTVVKEELFGDAGDMPGDISIKKEFLRYLEDIKQEQVVLDCDGVEVEVMRPQNEKNSMMNVDPLKANIIKNDAKWHIVRFKMDNVLHLCHSKEIYRSTKKEIRAKWVDGHYYACAVVSRGGEEEMKKELIILEEKLQRAPDHKICQTSKESLQLTYSRSEDQGSGVAMTQSNMLDEGSSDVAVAQSSKFEEGGSAVAVAQSSMSEEERSGVAVVQSSISEEGSSGVAVVQSSMSEEGISGVAVAHSSTSKNGKRVWDKKNYCLFCDQQLTNITRHFINKHTEELDVARVLSFPKKSKERKELFSVLVQKGNFKNNCNVIKSGTGVIIPKKRCSKNVDVKQMLPCDTCFAFYSKDYLSRHKKKCNNNNVRGARARGALLLPPTKAASDGLKQFVLSKMNHNKIFETVTNDPLIISYGNKLYEKLGNEAHQLRYVSNQLRELGRLTVVAREQLNFNGLVDLLTPSHYNTIVKSVRTVSLYDEQTHLFGIPSLALRLGTTLKKCAKIVLSMHIMNDNFRGRQAINDLITLFEANWKMDITSKALATLQKAKWNKPSHLPVAKDVTKFNKYIRDEIAKHSKSLSTEGGSEEWHGLCEACLCHLISFNRRRVGEVERLTIDSFKKCSRGTAQQEIVESLSQTEKILLQTLSRVEVRVKRGRKVAILFTNEMMDAINLLIEKRQLVGVDTNNNFVFAKKCSTGHYSACTVMRKLAIGCGAECPNNLTSTRLRKHVATISQILSLKDNELDMLATFMGHDIRVHREFYRLPEDTLQLARVSKLLMIIEKGKSHKVKGMTLEEINVETAIESDDSEVSDIPNDEDNDSSTQTLMRKSKTFNTSNNQLKMTNKKLKRNTTIKKRWSKEEKSAVINFFSTAINVTKKIPGKEACEKCKSANPVLLSRSWRDIKYFVYNLLKAAI